MQDGKIFHGAKDKCCLLYCFLMHVSSHLLNHFTVYNCCNKQVNVYEYYYWKDTPNSRNTALLATNSLNKA